MMVKRSIFQEETIHINKGTADSTALKRPRQRARGLRREQTSAESGTASSHSRSSRGQGSRRSARILTTGRALLTGFTQVKWENKPPGLLWWSSG